MIRSRIMWSFAVLFALAVLATPAFAGQARAASPIPGRLSKVQKGDWILVRTGEDLIKETVTEISHMKPDADVKPGDEAWFEPIFMVEYTLERFNGETGKASEKPMNVVRAQEHEDEENAETLKTMKGKPQRKNVTIDGKKIAVVVIPQVDDDGIQIENWYTDQFGIDGRAGIVVKLPGSEDTYSPLEVLSFGNAKQKANIQKYLKKKQ